MTSEFSVATPPSVAAARDLTHDQAIRLQTVGLYASGIAHDFNNALTIILSNADLLLHAYPDRDNVPAELYEVISAASHGAAMVRRVAQFVRPRPASPAPESVHEIAQRSARSMNALLHRRIEVHVDCDVPDGTLISDGGVLEEVVLNLATNARDAMPDGGTLRVTLRLAPADAAAGETASTQVLEVVVADNGIGLDDETMRRMFEPFFTTKGTRGGLGLGLAMTRVLVEQANGSVAVTSRQGAGTSITIRMPLAATR